MRSSTSNPPFFHNRTGRRRRPNRSSSQFHRGTTCSLWSEYSLSLTARSSALTAPATALFASRKPSTVLRMPWGTSSHGEGHRARRNSASRAANSLGGIRAHAQHPHLGGADEGLHEAAPDGKPPTYLYIELVLVPSLWPDRHRLSRCVHRHCAWCRGLDWVITAMASPQLVGAARRLLLSIPKSHAPHAGPQYVTRMLVRIGSTAQAAASHQTRRLIRGSNLQVGHHLNRFLVVTGREIPDKFTLAVSGDGLRTCSCGSKDTFQASERATCMKSISMCWWH